LAISSQPCVNLTRYYPALARNSQCYITASEWRQPIKARNADQADRADLRRPVLGRSARRTSRSTLQCKKGSSAGVMPKLILAPLECKWTFLTSQTVYVEPSFCLTFSASPETTSGVGPL
jgi:hypothetical protein